MNLTKLFEMQRELDERIVKEKGLEGLDLLPEKILALQVELGECANEWRGFKFWSKDQRPRTSKWVAPSMGLSFAEERNPLLEEYIDCLHFILSIGNIHRITQFDHLELVEESITFYFTKLLRVEWESKVSYTVAVPAFLKLGKMLGFTWEKIEEAYMSKNVVNHTRQSTGY
ncbi:dUTPase [compost metagenome]